MKMKRPKGAWYVAGLAEDAKQSTGDSINQRERAQSRMQDGRGHMVRPWLEDHHRQQHGGCKWNSQKRIWVAEFEPDGLAIGVAVEPGFRGVAAQQK